MDNGFSSVSSDIIATSTATGSLLTSVAPPDHPLQILQSIWPFLGLVVIIALGLIGTARRLLRNQSE